MEVKVIMCVRKPEDVGPRYVTICMAGHYSSSKDTFMVTSGTWDATKFALDDSDAETFMRHLNTVTKDMYEVVKIDERHLSTQRHEYWEDDFVNCGFKEHRMFNGVKLVN